MRPAKRSLAEAAEYYRLCVLAGLVEPAEVIAWADSVLADQSPPTEAMVELSCAVGRRPAELAKMLASLAIHSDKVDVRRGVLGMAARRWRHGASVDDAFDLVLQVATAICDGAPTYEWDSWSFPAIDGPERTADDALWDILQRLRRLDAGRDEALESATGADWDRRKQLAEYVAWQAEAAAFLATLEPDIAFLYQ